MGGLVFDASKPGHKCFSSLFYWKTTQSIRCSNYTDLQLHFLLNKSHNHAKLYVYATIIYCICSKLCIFEKKSELRSRFWDITILYVLNIHLTVKIMAYNFERF